MLTENLYLKTYEEKKCWFNFFGSVSLLKQNTFVFQKGNSLPIALYYTLFLAWAHSTHVGPYPLLQSWTLLSVLFIHFPQGLSQQSAFQDNLNNHFPDFPPIYPVLLYYMLFLPTSNLSRRNASPSFPHDTTLNQTPRTALFCLYFSCLF